MRRLALLLTLITVAVPGGAAGQEVSGGAIFQGYSFGRSDDLRLRSVRLLTLPFAVRGALSPGATLSVAGAYADGTATLTSGARADVGGLVDTRLALELRSAGVSLIASALLPTGDVVESEEELALVGLLSSDLLPFAISQWGTGGGFAGDVGYTFRPGTLSVLLSVGASYLAESTPLGGPLSYRPGREVRGRVTLEAPIGDAGVLSLSAGYQDFEIDTYGDANVFRPGSRVEGLASYAFPFGARESALAWVGAYRLGEGTPENPGGTPNALAGVSVHAARTLLTAGTELRFGRDGFDVLPRADVRVLRSADGIGQGWLASVGSGGELRDIGPLRGRNVRIEPAVALRFGRLLAAQDVEAWTLGLEAALTVRWLR